MQLMPVPQICVVAILVITVTWMDGQATQNATNRIGNCSYSPRLFITFAYASKYQKMAMKEYGEKSLV